MRILAFLTLAFVTFLPVTWGTNFEDAQKVAVVKKQLILVNFSGSDWCLPCMCLRKEIFETTWFKNFAELNLILVDADFPRNSKNKLSKEQVKLNEALADKYNLKGVFPLTILMTSDGKILNEWEGFPDVTPEVFVQQLKKYNDARN